MQSDAMQTEAMAQMRRRIVISSTIGNALEWFDFTVFGLFAGIIGKLFFPADNPSSSLMLRVWPFNIMPKLRIQPEFHAAALNSRPLVPYHAISFELWMARS